MVQTMLMLEKDEHGQLGINDVKCARILQKYGPKTWFIREAID
jgi:hypothetical protein